MNRIKELRKRKQLTQAQLAKMLHVSQGMISSYESGNYQPDNDMLIQLAEIFGVSIDVILGREEPAPFTLSEADIDTIAQRVQSRTAPALDEQLVEMLTALSPSQVQRVMDFVEGLKAADKA